MRKQFLLNVSLIRRNNFILKIHEHLPMILRLAYFLFFSSVSKLQISYSIVIATKCISIKKLFLRSSETFNKNCIRCSFGTISRENQVCSSVTSSGTDEQDNEPTLAICHLLKRKKIVLFLYIQDGQKNTD